jgi:transposase InsO family protein
MESFWGSMQIELLNRQRWRTHLELAIAMADYIDHFYNSERRHSSLGYLTPNELSPAEWCTDPLAVGRGADV